MYFFVGSLFTNNVIILVSKAEQIATPDDNAIIIMSKILYGTNAKVKGNTIKHLFCSIYRKYTSKVFFIKPLTLKKSIYFVLFIHS